MTRHKWTGIKARARPATRARMESEARRLSDELHLSQLRKARGLTQEAMADLLGVSQAEVSKMERRSELYIGTLRKFIGAMNGELVLAARRRGGGADQAHGGRGRRVSDRVQSRGSGSTSGFWFRRGSSRST